jgi:hypothetical protein
MRGDRFRSHHLPQVGADIAALRDVQLQRIALIRIGQLAAEEIRGKRLKKLPSWPAELGNCWKLYFDLHEHDVGRRLNRQAPRYRIVYRFLPPSDVPQNTDRRPRLQVLAVGPRRQAEVYERAAARLTLPDVKREQAIQPAERMPGPRPGRPALASGAARLAALARDSAHASRSRTEHLRTSVPPPPPLPPPQRTRSTIPPSRSPTQPQTPPPPYLGSPVRPGP